MNSTKTKESALKERIFYDPLNRNDWDTLEAFQRSIRNTQGTSNGVVEMRKLFSKRPSGMFRSEIPEKTIRKSASPREDFKRFLRAHGADENFPFECVCQVFTPEGVEKTSQQKNKIKDLFKIVKVTRVIRKYPYFFSKNYNTHFSFLIIDAQ